MSKLINKLQALANLDKSVELHEELNTIDPHILPEYGILLCEAYCDKQEECTRNINNNNIPDKVIAIKKLIDPGRDCIWKNYAFFMNNKRC